MNNKAFYFFLILIILTASFCDEVASVLFSLSQVTSATMSGVSFVLSSALLGGVVAGPVSTFVLAIFNPRSIICVSFLFSGVVIAVAAKHMSGWSVCLASFFLGSSGSVFWSSLAVLVPSCFKEEDLIKVNKFLHTGRNFGYVAGPLFAGILSANFQNKTALFIVSCFLIIVAPFSFMIFRKIKVENVIVDSNEKSNTQKSFVDFLPSFRSYFRLPKAKMVTIPLIVTILSTSTFNVAFIYLVIDQYGYSNAIYGYLISSLSIGLVIGPIAFTSYFERLGLEAGACLSAALIGFSIVLVSYTQHLYILVPVLAALGIANGVQNTLMSTYLMKMIPKSQLSQLMPTYMIIVQLSVLAGFYLGGLFPKEFAKSLLFSSGTIAVVAGLLGYILNRYIVLVIPKNS